MHDTTVLRGGGGLRLPSSACSVPGHRCTHSAGTGAEDWPGTAQASEKLRADAEALRAAATGRRLSQGPCAPPAYQARGPCGTGGAEGRGGPGDKSQNPAVRNWESLGDAVAMTAEAAAPVPRLLGNGPRWPPGRSSEATALP